MRILNCLMILIIILLMALMFGIHRDIQAIKKVINTELWETGPDNSTECRTFPCYTAPHKWQWVSQKYLTKGVGSETF